jgi:thioredoxin reductase
MNQGSPYDVVIVGGGPAGLSAALALGRGRKRVLLLDAGERRNAAAEHLHNFVTRDGTPPDAFRQVGREQLATYPNVEVREEHVSSISGSKGAFRLDASSGAIDARSVILATGMVDELLPLEGFRELWGRSIFQCPYCHGWEVQDRAWGYLGRAADAAHFVHFAIMIRGWTRDVVAFTGGGFEVPEEGQRALEAAGVRLETGPVARLTGANGNLEAVELESGARVARDVLFTHPPQRQVALVAALGLTLDESGFVQADPMTRATSIPGIHAAGDLTTRMQGAIMAAAAGAHAAAALNGELTLELASSGAL